MTNKRSRGGKKSEFTLASMDVTGAELDELVARNPIKRRPGRPPSVPVSEPPEELKRTTVKLPLSVHTRLKVLAAREKTTVYALLLEGVLGVLAARGG